MRSVRFREVGGRWNPRAGELSQALGDCKTNKDEERREERRKREREGRKREKAYKLFGQGTDTLALRTQ